MSDTKAMERLCGLMRKAVQQYEMPGPGDRVRGRFGRQGQRSFDHRSRAAAAVLGFPFVVAVTSTPSLACAGGLPALGKRCSGSMMRFLRGALHLIGPIVFGLPNEESLAPSAKMLGALHAAAEELDCNKVAPGIIWIHAIETFYMNLAGTASAVSPVTERRPDRGLTSSGLSCSPQSRRCAVR